jgi:hypothetical protein
LPPEVVASALEDEAESACTAAESSAVAAAASAEEGPCSVASGLAGGGEPQPAIARKSTRHPSEARKEWVIRNLWQIKNLCQPTRRGSRAKAFALPGSDTFPAGSGEADCGGRIGRHRPSVAPFAVHGRGFAAADQPELLPQLSILQQVARNAECGWTFEGVTRAVRCKTAGPGRPRTAPLLAGGKVGGGFRAAVVSGRGRRGRGG